MHVVQPAVHRHGQLELVKVQAGWGRGGSSERRDELKFFYGQIELNKRKIKVEDLLTNRRRRREEIETRDELMMMCGGSPHQCSAIRSRGKPRRVQLTALRSLAAGFCCVFWANDFY